jgi:hypothetical protein
MKPDVETVVGKVDVLFPMIFKVLKRQTSAWKLESAFQHCRNIAIAIRLYPQLHVQKMPGDSVGHPTDATEQATN